MTQGGLLRAITLDASRCSKHEVGDFAGVVRPRADRAREQGAEFLGFLSAILFFTPNIALISVLILPFVVLSGFKIGSTPKKR